MRGSTRSSRWNIVEPRAGETSAAGRLVEVAGCALLGAALLVVGEWATIGTLVRGEFAGPWELWDAFVHLVPLAWLLVALGAFSGSVVLVLCESPWRWSRVAVGALGGLYGLAIGAGVSGGRHLASIAIRTAFVVAVGAASFGVSFAVAPTFGRLTARSRASVALGAALAAVLFELSNRLILPRLYASFHLGLVVLTCMTAPLVGRGFWEVIRPGTPRLARRVLAIGVTLAVVLALVVARPNARRLALSDNLRFIFFDRAPMLRLGVELAGMLAPPPPLEPLETTVDAREGGRLEVDWRDKDILLISVDALRADHVGAYGYRRPTTPNIDSLARDGTLFLRAYCPTPHTSYSVTSMMTGKNLRPLLTQGLGVDSDTFAGLLRTYGYRTAAFYPPAVFFIDEELFARFRDRKLDFEYARVEFAGPHERARSVVAYLETQPNNRKLFLWVHLFEPHEPYVAHAEHPFGERDVDRYDSEVALADDGIGEIVAAVRARRPNTVVIVTADHGEEFGEHHGRYHGTTVYEEQVRVPLVVSAPGVARGRRVETPVQTIDILPSVVSALDIPRPPRIWGQSLGHWLMPGTSEVPPIGSVLPMDRALAPSASPKKTKEAPVALAATDDQAMLAQGEWRLVCARRAGACALYNLDLDPGETRDASAIERERFFAMKATLRRVEASQGIYESRGTAASGARPWPDAIRRGLAGDGESAREVAALLDDSDVGFRRKAAEVLFDLKRKEAAAELRLALFRDEDDTVRRFSALALTRLGEGAPRTAELLEDGDVAWRRLAALALAENGDRRGAAVLVAWWQSGPLAFSRAREILAALGQIRAKEAMAPLIRSLDDVRLRPYVAETLAAIGQPAARGPLAERFASERYQNARVAIGAALVQLSAKRELVAPLVRFLGTPDPLPGGVDLARRAGILDQIGGPSPELLARIQAHISDGVLAKLAVPGGGNGSGRRILFRAHTVDGRVGDVRIGARMSSMEPAGGMSGAAPGGREERVVELDPREAVTLEFSGDGASIEAFATIPPKLSPPGSADALLVLAASPNVVVEALAVVPLADELSPPPPDVWQPSTDLGSSNVSTLPTH